MKPQQIVILAFCLLLLAAVAFGVVAYFTRSPAASASLGSMLGRA